MDSVFSDYDITEKRMQIGSHTFVNGIFLAPMEDVTNLPFRLLCRKHGADAVYTEFTSIEGLVYGKHNLTQKITFDTRERPIAIQLFGSDPENARKAAKLAEKLNPDFIDINCGCWVRKVVQREAGAALLKNLPAMVKLVRAVIETVQLPVTVKTRLGWDRNSINIVEVAKRLEDCGISALTVHCRTRDMGHNGTPLWEWINVIKEHVSIPVILNGGISSVADALKAFRETNADAIMIGKAAIGNPFLFRAIKHTLLTGEIPPPPSIQERVKTCLEHLSLTVQYFGELRGIKIFRKYYNGYFRGLYKAAELRQMLNQAGSFDHVHTILQSYIEEISQNSHQKEQGIMTAVNT